MKLQQLTIKAEQKYLNGYGEKPVLVYIGVVKFKQEMGNIEILLTEEQIKGIVSVVGDGLVTATKSIATSMTQSILEETSQIKIGAYNDKNYHYTRETQITFPMYGGI